MTGYSGLIYQQLIKVTALEKKKLDIGILGKRLRDARLVYEWSQATLSKQSGVALGTITSLEQGRSKNIRTDSLLDIATTLAVSCDYLLGRTDVEKVAH